MRSDSDVPVVEAARVTREYVLGNGRRADAATVTALRGVSLAVGPGEFISIVGPSGSGKSTLLHLLGALDRPTTGELRFSGTEVSQLDDTAMARLRNREIGFVFQQFQLLARTSALANVMLPLVYRGLSRTRRRQLATEALGAVGLAGRLEHRPAQLSGGEQQRVAVARALVTEPRLILADEPTGNLDTRTGAEIIALLRSLNVDRGVALVVITHDAEVAQAAARQIHLRDGVIEAAA